MPPVRKRPGTGEDDAGQVATEAGAQRTAHRRAARAPGRDARRRHRRRARRAAPARLRRHHRHLRPGRTDRAALRTRRPRVRRREGGPGQGVRQPLGHHAAHRRRPAAEGHGLRRPRAARPRDPARLPGVGPVDLRLVRARRADRGHAAGLQRQLPERHDGELPDGRARLAHQRRDGRGDDPGRGLVHAVPEPHDRRARLRRRRLAVRLGRRGRGLQRGRLGPEREAAEPVRRPARAGGHGARAARLRGRRAALAGRADHGRPDGARRDDHPDQPADGRRAGRATRSRRRRTRTPSGSSPTACATRGG